MVPSVHAEVRTATPAAKTATTVLAHGCSGVFLEK
jgi:hypothetical protein